MNEPPIDLKGDVENLLSHCVLMRSIYLHGKILFETSTAKEKDLMERTSKVFFGDLNRVLIEYIILQVCKITDPAKGVRKSDNLTIAFLLQHLDLSGEPSTSRRVAKLREKLVAFREKLLPARNKLIAHSDRGAIKAGFALGAASKDEWNEFWSNLQDMICILHHKVVGGTPFYLNGVAGLSDAAGLLKALKHDDCFNQLLHDSDPAIVQKCADLALR